MPAVGPFQKKSLLRAPLTVLSAISLLLPLAGPGLAMEGSEQEENPDEVLSCDGNYLLAPAEPRGLIFDFDAPLWFPDLEIQKESKKKPDNKPEKSQETETTLKGYLKSEDSESDSESDPVLLPLVPKTHEENERKLDSLTGRIDQTELHLSKQKAMSDKEKNRLLVLRGVRYHGTTGILLIAYFMGPWMVHTVLKGTPAARYGLRAGDVIEKVDGESIRGMPIDRVFFRITGKRGQMKVFDIRRNGVAMQIKLPLWSIYDIKDRRSQYIEYYWYLLYHKAITLNQYHRLVKPFIYFDEPKLSSPPKSGGNKRKSR